MNNINVLLSYAIDNNLIDERDLVYYKNQVAYFLNIEPNFDFIYQDSNDVNIEELLNMIVKKYLDVDYDYEYDLLSSKLISLLMPVPSIFEEMFNHAYLKSPKNATEMFFNFSKVINYIKVNRVKRNISYKHCTNFGDFDITINLSKPEKDPKEIEQLLKLKNTVDYPKCLLCVEHEGYYGRIDSPDRSNHRMVELKLNDKPWLLQYSPYTYYNEHCIILNKEHTKMQINHDTFVNLFDFIDLFPHYFIGSNADLPIVGGSMLTHDHYQGGCYKFAMDGASSLKNFKCGNTIIEILNWPLSTIRLKSSSRSDLITLADKFLESWKNYTNHDLDIVAFSSDQTHNTITPIARYKDQYELDLVLRNNRTSEEYPFGIFHAHEDKHHIKKENIGLIEVMGLAVLPARLKSEMQELKELIENNLELTDNLLHHQVVYDSVKNESNVKDAIDLYIGEIFKEVLLDCSVFKDNILEFSTFIEDVIGS